ncbi:MAG: hypothetical protein QOG68_2133 [Solirubrobacteraceae bacterium]|nr:hypothetical protein [Solirubrobacteraceae bacterium]
MSRARFQYLRSQDDWLFSVLHLPEHDPSGIGVLFCPPVGWDEVPSYRSRREWAQHLAASGHAALRIDLPGEGDSSGGPKDPDRFAAWTAAASSAADWLRATADCRRVVAIGIGIGGLIAHEAVRHGAAIDDLVLWATPARGRTYLRELRAFALLEENQAVPEGTVVPPAPDDGALAPGGFLLSAATMAALKEIDLVKNPLADASGRRVLLIERDGLPISDNLEQCLSDAGAEVETSPGPGFGAMTAEPHAAQAPRQVFSRVDRWLVRADTTLPAAAPRATVESAEHMDLDVGGVTVRERAIRFESPGGEMFGILAEPVGRPSAAITFGLLNAGAIRRVGPNRMWVDIARRWAARGVPTLRLDVASVGDADGDSARYANVRGFYVPEIVDHVRGALTGVARETGSDRFVLAGLCSGAYWAFHAALEDSRVEKAVMVNPRLLYWDNALEIRRETVRLRRQSLRSIGRRIASGEARSHRARRLLRLTGTMMLTLPLRLAARRAPKSLDQAARAFDDLLARGGSATFMFSGYEPLHDEFELAGLFPPDRWPNIELVDLPGFSHTFVPRWTQAPLVAALDAALEDVLAQEP